MTAATHPAAAGLMAAIIVEPDDDGLRLIYADALEENGEPERAAFTRVQVELAVATKTCPCHQCALARGSSWCEPSAAACPSLRRRERELLDAHWRQWVPALDGREVCANLCDPDGRPSVLFRRGLVSEVTLRLADWRGARCGSCMASGLRSELPDGVPPRACTYCRGTGRLSAHGPALARAAPIETVRFTDLRLWHSPAFPAGGYPETWGVIEESVRSAPFVPEYAKSGEPYERSEAFVLKAWSDAALAWARAQPPPSD